MAVRQNWHEIPYGQLTEAEIAAMPQRERNWYADWSRETRINAARLEAVAQAVRVARTVIPCCGNCEEWRNSGSAWGGCWSRDSMGDEFSAGPTRITLAGDRCEAWTNSLVVFDGENWRGADSLTEGPR